MQELSYWERLKIKWDLKSDWSLVKIFCVFAITGTSSAKIGAVIETAFLPNLDKTSIVGLLLYILLVTIIYQPLLLFVAFIFGEFDFFKKKFVRIFKRKKEV